ncbi:hypothetical protein QQY66_01005 [Streptomyces sp. DG2A-72]|uniref:hypothetical protein n=1 Tax=Streptomyces sp. DG2A-72 TaxID=3051386 RepID=UPI00265B8D07|nr:hypothetical protein [Streptomyces sp. DG2A-72]MDO0930347.1 hypothetical protein [Streptomyces sp. DG2A-72]
MTAWQILKRLLQSGRGLLLTLVVLDALVAWAAVAWLMATYRVAAGAPAVLLNVLPITHWSHPEWNARRCRRR